MSTLSRALQIIEYMASRQYVRFKDVQEILPGICNSSISSILQSLTELGYISKDRRRYFLTKKISSNKSSNIENIDIFDQHSLVIHNILEELQVKNMLPAGIMAMMGETTMKILDSISASSYMNFRPVNTEMELYPCHGFAQVFTAFMNEKLQKTICNRQLLFKAEKEWTFADFKRKMARIKEEEINTEIREQYAYLCRFTAPVFLKDQSIPFLVIGQIGPTGTEKHSRMICQNVRNAAHKIEKLLISDPVQNS